MKKIVTIVGARPQFIKLAPLSLALKNSSFTEVSIHTGQHYDAEMSDVFFKELNISEPTYKLSIGSSSHGRQTGEMLIQIEELLLVEKPIAVVVFGDTNTTLAGALAAAKLNIKLIHIESGLRSYNKQMPEEINRIITDQLSTILFTSTETACANLNKEGLVGHVYNVGDIMQDSLNIGLRYLEHSKTSFVQYKHPFILATIHRNYNTDDVSRLVLILEQLNRLPNRVVFPIHPRTKNKLSANGYDLAQFGNIEFIPPLGYFSFLQAMQNCEYIITDSGGVQKEAYMIKKPCVTVRFETEWVETLVGGWNTLVGNELSNISLTIPKPNIDRYVENLYGTGNAAQNIIQIIEKNLAL